jgi:hypothetical protein
MLLDLGADPNAYYMAGDSRYSALVGVACEGEQDSPRQPQAPDLFKLLLDLGAKPFDLQVLYNTHFNGDVLWWLQLVYDHTMKSELKHAWDDPNWEMFEMGPFGTAAHLLLHVAVFKNDLNLAEWVLSHGASPNPRMPTKLRYKPSHTPYEFAVITNLVEMCKLFEHYGVNRVSVADFKGEESLLAACFRMDRDEVSAQMKAHPEFLQSPEVIYAAAQRDRADVVALLLGLGIPIEITNKTNKRAIHEAAAHNALRVARLLVERGVEIGPIETTWDTTPIGWAAHADHVEMVEYLSEFTRDIWTLSFLGLRRSIARSFAPGSQSCSSR